jgi:hypothetical protein
MKEVQPQFTEEDEGMPFRTSEHHLGGDLGGFKVFSFFSGRPLPTPGPVWVSRAAANKERDAWNNGEPKPVATPGIVFVPIELR